MRSHGLIRSMSFVISMTLLTSVLLQPEQWGGIGGSLSAQHQHHHPAANPFGGGGSPFQMNPLQLQQPQHHQPQHFQHQQQFQMQHQPQAQHHPQHQPQHHPQQPQHQPQHPQHQPQHPQQAGHHPGQILQHPNNVLGNFNGSGIVQAGFVQPTVNPALLQNLWLNQTIQALGHLESNEDRYERQEERLDRLWEKGLISDSKYNQLLDDAAKRLGVQDPEFVNYNPGWQGRQTQYQQMQTAAPLNVDQKKLAIEYVKFGDRPLATDKGQIPKPNPVLSSPVAYDAASSTRFAKTILTGVKDDVAGLRKTLPAGCRIEDAVALIEKLKKDGGQQALIDNLQGAMVDRDVRRFERNAQALSVPMEDIQRMLIGLTVEHLQDKLEDGAPLDEITKITEPMVRRVDQAGLEAEFSTALAAWMQSIPELLKTQQELDSGKAMPAPAWPNGEVQLIFDPQLASGETRLLPGGMLAAGGDGEGRVLVGTGNKYTANGLPVLKGATAVASETSKPEVPTLLLDYSGDGTPLQYTIICFQDQPTQTPAVYQAKEAWRQNYTIKPGLKQPLPLALNGRTWYQINCQTKDGTGQSQNYSLKPLAGRSPTYAFRVAGNAVTLVSASANVTLDNSLNARPFQYMLGNEYRTVRAGAKQTFDSGVTLQYARNGKTAAPKDAKGQPIPNATGESAEISAVTLRGSESAVVGVNTNGDWEVRSGGEIQIAERKSINLPIASVPPTPESLATATRGTLYVLAVGVADYEQLNPLTFAAKDVTVLTDVLKKQKTLFQDVKATILTNKQAKVFDVRKELVGLARKATKNDTVAVILSGHGIIDEATGLYYYCPHDFDPKKVVNKGISSKELMESVTDKLVARNVFIFLDSCCSGGATDKFQQQFDKQVSSVSKSGVVIFASSKGTESSQENQSWGHGALTKAFLDTMGNLELDLNKDSIVQIKELDNGLTEGVKSLTSGGQHLQSAELGNSIRNLSLVRFSPGVVSATE
jgi:hypothetical protein